MKQKILLLAMALLGCMNVVQAKDGITFEEEEITIKQGGFGCITINCIFNEDKLDDEGKKVFYDALQIEFELPEGLTFNQAKDVCYVDANGIERHYTGIEDPIFIMGDKKQDTGGSTFIFMNMEQAGQNYFNRGEYQLVKIYFEADKKITPGLHEINILNFCLSGTDGKNYAPDEKEVSQQVSCPASFIVNITEAGPRVLKDIATKLPEPNYTYSQKYYKILGEDPNTGEPIYGDPVTGQEGLFVDYTKSETVPEDFTVERTIKANTWSTMCLPFAVTLDELNEALDNPEIVYWDGWDFENDELSVLFYTQEDDIDANYPFLIKTSKDFSQFTIKDKILETDEDAAEVEITKGSGKNKKYSYFTGVLKAGTVPDGSLFFSGNKFYYSTGSSSIRAFRAYLTLHDELSSKQLGDGNVNIGVMINDTPTYIEDISTKLVSNDDVYSVSGIKMGTESDLKHMKPGIYIVNGKKVIIK